MSEEKPQGDSKRQGILEEREKQGLEYLRTGLGNPSDTKRFEISEATENVFKMRGSIKGTSFELIKQKSDQDSSVIFRGAITTHGGHGLVLNSSQAKKLWERFESLSLDNSSEDSDKDIVSRNKEIDESLEMLDIK